MIVMGGQVLLFASKKRQGSDLIYQARLQKM